MKMYIVSDERLRSFLSHLDQSISIPFWMVGHVHLSINVYQDIHELIMSLGMNILVGIGFYLDYKQQQKQKDGKER